jgi:hypothetical protein
MQRWSHPRPGDRGIRERAPFRVLADGTYLSVLIDANIRGRRREQVLQAARDGGELDPGQAYLVREIEYDVPDREGNGTGELIVLLTSVLDPADARSDELADTYHQRWEQETGHDQLKTQLRGPRPVAAFPAPGAGLPRDLGLADRPLRLGRVDHPGGRGRRRRPRPGQLHPGPAHRPPDRDRDGGLSP